MDKRGAAYTVLELIRNTLMSVIVVITIVTFVLMILQQTGETRPTEAEIYTRIIYDGETAFSARDELTGRRIIGTIDERKFTAESAEQTFYHPSNRYIAAELWLIDNEDRRCCGMVYWNKEWWDNYAPVTMYPGPGSPYKSQTFEGVFIKRRDGSMHRGMLSVSVVVP